MKLENIQKLCDEATPEPWQWGPGNPIDHWELWNPIEHVWIVQDDAGVEPRFEDLEFIAISRTLIPQLLAIAEAVKDEEFAKAMHLVKELEKE